MATTVLVFVSWVALVPARMGCIVLAPAKRRLGHPALGVILNAAGEIPLSIPYVEGGGGGNGKRPIAVGWGRPLAQIPSIPQKQQHQTSSLGTPA